LAWSRPPAFTGGLSRSVAATLVTNAQQGVRAPFTRRTVGEEHTRRPTRAGAKLTVRHLHILCEGQTEEIVVRQVIAPHYSATDIRVTHSIFTIKRPAGGPAFKGGLSNWPKLERELLLLLRDSSTTVLTTIFDYYAFPADAPGMADRPPSPELVDDGVDTAPSKRIMNAYPQYAKTIDGPLVIADAGLDSIRRSCPHANDWLREIGARLRHQPTR
jgi:Domain of unknown function (DUF4276)